MTKWVGAKALLRVTEKLVIEFIYEEIFTRFWIPCEIVTDNGAQFVSKSMKALTEQYGVKQYKSSPYHPQANGQVE